MAKSSGGKAQKQGSKFEKVFGGFLEGNERYAVHPQLTLDSGKPDGRKARIDAMVYDRTSNERIICSCKSQTSSGSVEEKMVWELMLLSHFVHTKQCERAYMILLGNGFSDFKRFIQSSLFRKFMPHLAWGRPWEDVAIVGMDDVVTRINKEEL